MCSSVLVWFNLKTSASDRSQKEVFETTSATTTFTRYPDFGGWAVMLIITLIHSDAITITITITIIITITDHEILGDGHERVLAHGCRHAHARQLLVYIIMYIYIYIYTYKHIHI